MLPGRDDTQPAAAGLQRSDSLATIDRRAQVLGITKWDLNRFRRLFAIADIDGSGRIDREEMRHLLCDELGWDLPPEKVDELIAEVDDVDSGGGREVGLDGFLQLMVIVSKRAEASGSNRRAARNVARERIRRATQAPQGYVLPDEPIRGAADLVKLACAFYYGVCVLLWDIGHYDPPVALEWCITGLCAAHLVLTLRTCRPGPHGGWMTAGGLLRAALGSPYTLADIVGTVPLDLIARTSGGSYALVTTLYHLRLVLIVTTPALFGTSTRTTMSAKYVLWRWRIVPAVSTTFWLLLFLHWLSCIWVGIHGTHYDYIEALYFVLYTTTTVGYGDVDVDGRGPRLFSCALFLVGVVGQGVILGYITAAVMQSNVDGDLRERMLTTSAVLRHFGVPSAVQAEVLGFQHHSLRNHVSTVYADVVSQLPEAMQDHVTLFIKMRFLKVVPMFRDADTQTRAALAQSLRNEVFPPDTHVVIAGEEGEEMFFLAHGFCDVVSYEGDHIVTLRNGACFGEIALLVNSRRTASVVTVTFCDLFVLSLDDFYMICDAYPCFAESIRTEIAMRGNSSEAEAGYSPPLDAAENDPAGGAERTASYPYEEQQADRPRGDVNSPKQQELSANPQPQVGSIPNGVPPLKASSFHLEQGSPASRYLHTPLPTSPLPDPFRQQRLTTSPKSGAPVSALGRSPSRNALAVPGACGARATPANATRLMAAEAAKELAVGSAATTRLKRALGRSGSTHSPHSGAGMHARQVTGEALLRQATTDMVDRLASSRLGASFDARRPSHLPSADDLPLTAMSTAVALALPGIPDGGRPDGASMSPRSSLHSEARNSVASATGQRSPRLGRSPRPLSASPSDPGLQLVDKSVGPFGLQRTASVGSNRPARQSVQGRLVRPLIDRRRGSAVPMLMKRQPSMREERRRSSSSVASPFHQMVQTVQASPPQGLSLDGLPATALEQVSMAADRATSASERVMEAVSPPAFQAAVRAALGDLPVRVAMLEATLQRIEQAQQTPPAAFTEALALAVVAKFNLQSTHDVDRLGAGPGSYRVRKEFRSLSRASDGDPAVSPSGSAAPDTWEKDGDVIRVTSPSAPKDVSPREVPHVGTPPTEDHRQRPVRSRSQTLAQRRPEGETPGRPSQTQPRSSRVRLKDAQRFAAMAD